MKDRRLTLRREALTELTADELAMAGAAAPPTFQPNCESGDPNNCVREWTLYLTLHCHCSWSCI